MKEPISITGVWLRNLGSESGPKRTEVLVEVEGVWRMVVSYTNIDQCTCSHIVEPAGIRSSPADLLTAGSAGVEFKP